MCCRDGPSATFGLAPCEARRRARASCISSIFNRRNCDPRFTLLLPPQVKPTTRLEKVSTDYRIDSSLCKDRGVSLANTTRITLRIHLRVPLVVKNALHALHTQVFKAYAQAKDIDRNTLRFTRDGTLLLVRAKASIHVIGHFFSVRYLCQRTLLHQTSSAAPSLVQVMLGHAFIPPAATRFAVCSTI